jgi:hypothetical protein
MTCQNFIAATPFKEEKPPLDTVAWRSAGLQEILGRLQSNSQQRLSICNIFAEAGYGEVEALINAEKKKTFPP